MKCLLITVAFVALFCPSESVIKCYDCIPGPSLCKTEKNCSSEYDSCIWVSLGEQRESYNCWKYSQCDGKNIEKHFNTGTFTFRCCKSDLCNSSPLTMAGSMISLSIASFLTTLLLI
ncbi:PREDICTED: CD59 glycoprotein [Gekko japonicus]|uniref:MAC-inhibitory protein n=1 Tax=Gekko japonicus TaxID=146911 RepID=D9IVG0_GEKJA|nr:PREDICTED: CD59 glycoprotein [Gekko japonicus]ADJ67507.1 glycosylphosphatidylinositol-anchored protein [Gekko japonicus]